MSSEQRCEKIQITCDFFAKDTSQTFQHECSAIATTEDSFVDRVSDILSQLEETRMFVNEALNEWMEKIGEEEVKRLRNIPVFGWDEASGSDSSGSDMDG